MSLIEKLIVRVKKKIGWNDRHCVFTLSGYSGKWRPFKTGGIVLKMPVRFARSPIMYKIYELFPDLPKRVVLRYIMRIMAGLAKEADKQGNNDFYFRYATFGPATSLDNIERIAKWHGKRGRLVTGLMRAKFLTHHKGINFFNMAYFNLFVDRKPY